MTTRQSSTFEPGCNALRSVIRVFTSSSPFTTFFRCYAQNMTCASLLPQPALFQIPNVILSSIAAAPLLIWSYLLLGRGGFWLVARQCSAYSPHHNVPRNVIAIIPARNEAEFIGAAVRSLLQQAFAGSLSVIVVDDASADGTAQAAEEAAASLGAAARLSVISAGAPEPGWNGKVWAMSRGVLAAGALRPDYLLFTDADIAHERDNLATLVDTAETH